MKLIYTGSQIPKNAEISNIGDEEVVMLVDVDRCIRCGTCQLACAMEYGEEGKPGGSVTFMWVRKREKCRFSIYLAHAASAAPHACTMTFTTFGSAARMRSFRQKQKNLPVISV